MHLDYDTNAELSRYLVRNAQEIEQLMLAMKASRTLVTLHADNGRDALLSLILGIEPKAGVFYMDPGPDARTNAALLASEAVTLTARHEQVSIQFRCGRPLSVQFQGGAAFRLALPESVLRLQRREFYRLLTPLSTPLKCRLPLAPEPLEATLTDISLGGVGLLYPPSGQLAVGQVYKGCRLTIPGDEAPLSLGLAVCGVKEERLRNGLLAMKAGCRFVDLDEAVAERVQRYISRLERERRGRL